MTDERMFLAVGDLVDGRFAVMEIYPDIREGGGCKGVVRSIHESREDAELWCPSRHETTSGLPS